MPRAAGQALRACIAISRQPIEPSRSTHAIQPATWSEARCSTIAAILPARWRYSIAPRHSASFPLRRSKRTARSRSSGFHELGGGGRGGGGARPASRRGWGGGGEGGGEAKRAPPTKERSAGAED